MTDNVLPIRPEVEVDARDPAAKYLDQLSPNSRRVMRIKLVKACEILDFLPDQVQWELLRYDDMTNLRRELAASCSPSTANLTLAAVKGVLKACRNMQLMSNDDYVAATDVRGVKGSRLAAGRALEVDQARKLFAACRKDSTALGYRDAALVALMLGGGLRRAEAIAVTVARWDGSDGSVSVIGKGNKERKVSLLGKTARYVDEWLEVRGSADGPILCAVSMAGRQDLQVGQSLGSQSAVDRIALRARAAGVGRVTPHDLRRTYATLLLDTGADLFVVQRLMGHASPATTARYDRRGEKAASAACARVRLW